LAPSGRGRHELRNFAARASTLFGRAIRLAAKVGFGGGQLCGRRSARSRKAIFRKLPAARADLQGQGQNCSRQDGARAIVTIRHLADPNCDCSAIAGRYPLSANSSRDHCIECNNTMCRIQAPRTRKLLDARMGQGRRSIVSIMQQLCTDRTTRCHPGLPSESRSH
jgi:hypothetical protein